MEIKIFDTKTDLFEELKTILTNEVRKNPQIVLGLATGSTPLPLYEKLIIDHKLKGTSYKDVKTFNLDEYVGLNCDDEDSYSAFMTNNLFNHIDIDINNTHIPIGTVKNSRDECMRYDLLIEKNPIDIQLLGIGVNGHIGFNEPGTSFNSKTIVVDLTKDTLNANVKYFDSMEEIPKAGITMGIGTINKSKQIILIATGYKKADAIYKTIKGPITKDVPASSLRNHPNVTVYLDKEAASKL